MAVASATIPASNATNAAFRLWGKFISDLMLAGGFVKTSDTSQIDWTTVPAPVAVSTWAGYEIWESQDGASLGLSNYRIKIRYGSGTGSASNTACEVSVGWGSDGAGNLTGFVTIPKFNQAGGTSGSPQCNLSAKDGSWVAGVMFGFSGLQCSFAFSVERTRDNNGDQQDEVLFFFFEYNAWKGQVCHKLDGLFAQFGALGAENVLVPNWATSTSGSKNGYALFFGQRGGFTNPSINVIFAPTSPSAGNLGTPQSTVDLVNFGTTRRYIINVVSPNAISGSTCLIMRYEV